MTAFEKKLAEIAGDPGACWIWKWGKNWRGYGKASVNSKTKTAHRAAYEFLVGPVPEGLVIDHLCRNRDCVNPAHMEPVTNRENILRGNGVAARNAQKTHCKRGHEFTPETTYKVKNGRACKVCSKKYYADNSERIRERTKLHREKPDVKSRALEWRKEYRSKKAGKENQNV